jgi:hypothetical protein
MDIKMQHIEVIKNLIAIAERKEERYFDFVKAIALIFPPQLKEQLAQLVRGPVWDGDVMSKSQRGELFDMGIAIRVCAKGEQGYTGARYIAYSILKEIDALPNS